MTLSDYLFLLRASSEALSPLGRNVMFYLAAAVSDFYIPDNELVISIPSLLLFKYHKTIIQILCLLQH